MSEEIKGRLETAIANAGRMKMPLTEALYADALALITSLTAELTAARGEVARKDEALDGLVKWFSDPPQRMDDWGVGYFLPKSVEPDVQAALAALTPAEEGERG